MHPVGCTGRCAMIARNAAEMPTRGWLRCGLSRQPPNLAHDHDQVGGIHLDNIGRGMVANPDGDTLHGFLDGRPLGVGHAHHAIQMTIAAMPITA